MRLRLDELDDRRIVRDKLLRQQAVDRRNVFDRHDPPQNS